MRSVIFARPPFAQRPIRPKRLVLSQDVKFRPVP
jgi:hypothetical protein